MRSLFSRPIVAAHAIWLAELKDALEQCDRLLMELHREHPFGIDTAILTARVTTLRNEIMQLEERTEGRQAIDPKWMNIFGEAAQTPCETSPPPPNSLI